MSEDRPKTTTVTGTVTSVSQFGVKLDHGDDWINLPYGVKDMIMPAKGQRVTLTLNAKGKILHIVPATGQEGGPPEAPQTHQEAQPATKTDWARKDALMVRMSCLRGACEIIAASGVSGDGVASAQRVTAMAAAFERWVNREADEPDITIGRDVPDWADVNDEPPAAGSSTVEARAADTASPAQPSAPSKPVFATVEQVDIIRGDVKHLGWTGSRARQWLHALYGTPDPTTLTVAQANAAIELLSRERAASGPAPQRPAASAGAR